MKCRRGHFTLLEVLLAIGVVVILAGITMGGLRYASSRSDEARTHAVMKEFEMALQKYKSDHGIFPVWKDADDVKDGIDFDKYKLDTSHTDNWKKFRQGGYLQGSATGMLQDGYDQPLFYRFPGTKNTGSYDLWSKGPDKKHGSPDDINDAGEGDIDDAGKAGSDDICNWRSGN